MFVKHAGKASDFLLIWFCTRESTETSGLMFVYIVETVQFKRLPWKHTWWGTQMVSHAQCAGRNSIANYTWNGICINTQGKNHTSVTPVGKAGRLHTCSSFTWVNTQREGRSSVKAVVFVTRGNHIWCLTVELYISGSVHSCARFCSKAFRLNSELKQHMIVHTGERPFPCPRCGKKFKKKCHLRQHGEKACR